MDSVLAALAIEVQKKIDFANAKEKPLIAAEVDDFASFESVRRKFFLRAVLLLLLLLILLI